MGFAVRKYRLHWGRGGRGCANGGAAGPVGKRGVAQEWPFLGGDRVEEKASPIGKPLEGEAGMDSA
jgi:hypothetical protein